MYKYFISLTKYRMKKYISTLIVILFSLWILITNFASAGQINWTLTPEQICTLTPSQLIDYNNTQKMLFDLTKSMQKYQSGWITSTWEFVRYECNLSTDRKNEILVEQSNKKLVEDFSWFNQSIGQMIDSKNKESIDNIMIKVSWKLTLAKKSVIITKLLKFLKNKDPQSYKNYVIYTYLVNKLIENTSNWETQWSILNYDKSVQDLFTEIMSGKIKSTIKAYKDKQYLLDTYHTIINEKWIGWLDFGGLSYIMQNDTVEMQNKLIDFYSKKPIAFNKEKAYYAKYFMPERANLELLHLEYNIPIDNLLLWNGFMLDKEVLSKLWVTIYLSGGPWKKIAIPYKYIYSYSLLDKYTGLFTIVIEEDKKYIFKNYSGYNKITIVWDNVTDIFWIKHNFNYSMDYKF